MYVRPVIMMDQDTEFLLRRRARDRGRDVDSSVHHLHSALSAGKVGVVCLHDDAGAPCGLSAWRWQDDTRSYAQIIMLYTPLESPPKFAESLADHVITALCREPSLQVIEARMRDQSPGMRDALTRRDFVVFERCRMQLRLGSLPLPVIPTPDKFRVVAWQEEHQRQADQLIVAAHRQSIDAAAAPESAASATIETVDRLRSGSLPSAGVWNPAASLVLLGKRDRVVGCIAVATSQMNGSAAIMAMAVDPPAKTQDIARLLLVRSMTACLKQGLASVSLTVTKRDPNYEMACQLGFQPADCGEVATWWSDGRQKAWQ